MTILVLDGNENQAVAATRSLRAAGHVVHVGAETAWSKAGLSRTCAGRVSYPSPADDADGFVSAIERACLARGVTLVLPMTERAMLPLSAQREALARAGARLILPDHERVQQACSKEAITALARTLGITVPPTWALGDDDAEAMDVAPRLPYPVVLKPAMSHEPIGRRVRSTGAPLYARDPAQFAAQYRRLRQRARGIIVQPFLEGTGAGYFALVEHGRVLAEFAHRRIRDVRPTGSGSAVRESVAINPELARPARALLGALRWHGVAMVEYRVTDAGTPVFLELNPRFWTSLPLAIAAGVDFPALLVELAEHGRISPLPPYRVGVRCRWWVGDVQHLAQVWRGAPEGYPGRFPRRLATLAAFLTPHRGTVHDNFRWSDPLPEVADWLHFVGRRVPAWLNRRDRRRVELTDVQGRAAHS